MTRTLRMIGVRPIHPRQPEPSYIELALLPEGRKSGNLDIYTLTETQTLELAEQCLTVTRILRDNRASAAAFAEMDRLDREAHA